MQKPAHRPVAQRDKDSLPQVEAEKAEAERKVETPPHPQGFPVWTGGLAAVLPATPGSFQPGTVWGWKL